MAGKRNINEKIINDSNTVQKFTRDVLWVASSQVLLVLAGMIVIPALTKSFGSEIYGIWAQVTITVGLLAPILTLHLHSAFIRLFSVEEDKEKLRLAFGTMVWPIIFLGVIIFITSLILERSFAIIIFSDTKYMFFVPLIFLWSFTEALFIFVVDYFRARHKIKRRTILWLSYVVAKMTIVLIQSILGYSLFWIILTIIILECVLIIIVFVLIIEDIGIPIPSTKGLKN